jgi:hypothetical protein
MLLLLAWAFITFTCAQIIPLRVTTITPGSNSGVGADTLLRGRDALTVVFSRSVIAMGSDFGASSPSILGVLPNKEHAIASNLPFYVTSNGALKAVPGKLRWVTTYIARFDPDIDWPLDLKFELVVNPTLTAWDSTRLTSSDSNSARSIRTGSLRCANTFPVIFFFLFFIASIPPLCQNHTTAIEVTAGQLLLPRWQWNLQETSGQAQ